MDYGYKTDVGKVRDINEDRYLFVNESDYVLLAVADGMGGHNAGDIASTIAIDEILRYNLKLGFFEDTEKRLEECIESVNKKIYEYSSKTPGCHGMGTTIALAIVINNELFVANVGDSRAYLISDDIVKITIDHSYVEELVLLGKITKEEAKNHPNKNQITRAVGTEKTVKVDIFSRKIKEDDIVLLCSDGLSNMVNDTDINIICKKNNTLQQASDQLVSLANKNGGHDNITVVCYTNKKGEI